MIGNSVDSVVTLLKDTVDCVVGEWTEWSDVDRTTGLSNRTRQIMYHPLNNGTECPELEDSRNGVCNSVIVSFDTEFTVHKGERSFAPTLISRHPKAVQLWFHNWRINLRHNF